MNRKGFYKVLRSLMPIITNLRTIFFINYCKICMEKQKICIFIYSSLHVVPHVPNPELGVGYGVENKLLAFPEMYAAFFKCISIDLFPPMWRKVLVCVG